MKFLLGMALGAGLVIFATVILNVKWPGRERKEESTEEVWDRELRRIGKEPKFKFTPIDISNGYHGDAFGRPIDCPSIDCSCRKATPSSPLEFHEHLPKGASRYNMSTGEEIPPPRPQPDSEIGTKQ